jgi:hypothetical protein
MAFPVSAVPAARFVIRSRGSSPPAAAEIETIRRSPHVRVLDESSPNMLLVEATEEELRKTLDTSRWIITPEVSIPLPDPRMKIRTPPLKKK